MPSVSVGGVPYELAGLRVADLRNIDKLGYLKKLQRWNELEGWERTDIAAEVVSASIRRAGGNFTPEALVENACADELAPLIAAVALVFQVSKLAGGGDDRPNVESPTTSTSVG